MINSELEEYRENLYTLIRENKGNTDALYALNAAMLALDKLILAKIEEFEIHNRAKMDDFNSEDY